MSRHKQCDRIFTKRATKESTLRMKTCGACKSDFLALSGGHTTFSPEAYRAARKRQQLPKELAVRGSHAKPIPLAWQPNLYQELSQHLSIKARTPPAIIIDAADADATIYLNEPTPTARENRQLFSSPARPPKNERSCEPRVAKQRQLLMARAPREKGRRNRCPEHEHVHS